MDVINKTRKPLSIPLPGGKRLFLGPGKTGQISPKALEHPPLAKLIESGDIEAAEGEHEREERASGNARAYPGRRQGGAGVKRPSGDR